MEMTAAKPRERSYPADFSGRWWRTISRPTRTPQATATAAAPANVASTSLTCARVSSTPTTTGTHQRSGARSSTSSASRMGTAVPKWSGPCISTRVPSTSEGASRMPPPSNARTTPSRPRALPLASNAVSSTTAV